jgi:hypothetical protein
MGSRTSRIHAVDSRSVKICGLHATSAWREVSL